MASKRFEIMASGTELVTVAEKTAIRIELQYGKNGDVTEIVIAELYRKDDEWAYTRSQVRIPCTTANAKYLLETTKAMYDSSTKVVKKETSKVETAVDKMSDTQKAELLAALLASEKPAAKAKAKKSDDIVLDANLYKRGKK